MSTPVGETAVGSLCSPARQLVTQISSQERLLPPGSGHAQLDFGMEKGQMHPCERPPCCSFSSRVERDVSRRVRGAAEPSQEISHRSEHWMWDFSVLSLFACALWSP